jgi:D-alanyl-D-alanine carboxypeptidase (penicillin-binding protein 5/6)
MHRNRQFVLVLLLLLPALSTLTAQAQAEAPAVTAKAWAIADGRTGEVLWGFQPDEPRKSASTTKMMCLWTVLQLAEADPGVLNERVTFSKLADATPGSTADINAGESLPVWQCLYGLMLPSGNDAGNALAEHFDVRFAPPEDWMPAVLRSTNLTTRARFIAEMNRHARRLGMTKTVYRSSFGDGGTDDERTTTVRDLLRLAAGAMKHPRFRNIVGTPRFETRVLRPDGTYRNVMWENTNQLLGVDGFDGVKTGTTTLAGQCLVSSCRRGRDHLLGAVLGATSDEGRYTDTRALFDWAWAQRKSKR